MPLGLFAWRALPEVPVPEGRNDPLGMRFDVAGATGVVDGAELREGRGGGGGRGGGVVKISHSATKFDKKLDVDPQRDDDASPMSTYRCMLRPT